MNSLQKTKEMPLRQSAKPFQMACKRLFDIVFSAIALVIFSPVFLVLAVMIIKEDGRPVFYRQKRSGKGDVPFLMYKFRSMKMQQSRGDSQAKESPYQWKNGVPDDFVFKTSSEHNPNITKVGGFIRKYSLDELPQFLNVLKGDMSLIGPRPEIVEITRCYSDAQRARLLVKPGITGYAQANGRSEINHGQKIEYDLYYVQHISLWLDVKILLKTVGQVLTGRGSV